MITLKTVPEGYSPYQTLTVCSNVIMGGGHFVTVGDALPLLIGSGKMPMVWLQAPSDQTAKIFVPIVAASVALHPGVIVVREENALTVSVGGTQVLHVVQKKEDSAEVDQLDFRPIGLNIFGDASSMTVGGSTFSRNTFSGGGTFLALG